MSSLALSESIRQSVLTSIFVDQSFKTILESKISISQAMRSQASDSQRHVREVLSGEYRKDITFPKVLSKNDSDFIGGSFSRHTKIWPLDDIDIYVPLDGGSLCYSIDGVVQPITVISDGTLLEIIGNPILQEKWMNGTLLSSQKLIAGFAKVLNRSYPNETKIKKDGQAITVRLSYGSGSSNERLGLDIVPCFSLQPHNYLQDKFYLIPDGNDGWISTNPRIDIKIAERLHKNNNETYRKVVKLLKYWNQTKLNGSVDSYYIEVAVARLYLEKNKKLEFINDVSTGVALGFQAFYSALSKGEQEPFLARAPSVKPGTDNILKLLTVQIASIDAANASAYERRGDWINSKKEWQKVFGDEFK